MFMRSLVVMILAVLLTACSTLPVSKRDSHFTGLPVGTWISLNQALPLHGNFQRILYQNGKHQVRLRKFQPYCFFTIDPSQADVTRPTLLRADRFEVVALRKRKAVIGIDSYKIAGITGETMFLDWIATLASASQPHLRTLTCGIYEDPYEYNYLTVTQMQAALGRMATISLP